MSRYLVLEGISAARARTAAAWDVVRPPASRQPGDVTKYLWGVEEHPADGLGACAVPDTPQECGIAYNQGQYDALLTGGEIATLINSLPAEWKGKMVRGTTVTSIATAGNVTYTAAQIASGTIIRDPNGAARTDTLPTAAELVSAFPGIAVGDVRDCLIVNGADLAEVITIAAGAGGSFDVNQTAASRNVQRNASKLIRLKITNVSPGTEAYAVVV